jgi:hypothetical protein
MTEPTATPETATSTPKSLLAEIHAEIAKLEAIPHEVLAKIEAKIAALRAKL